jgi:hypothetical protein
VSREIAQPHAGPAVAYSSSVSVSGITAPVCGLTANFSALPFRIASPGMLLNDELLPHLICYQP